MANRKHVIRRLVLTSAFLWAEGALFGFNGKKRDMRCGFSKEKKEGESLSCHVSCRGDYAHGAFAFGFDLVCSGVLVQVPVCNPGCDIARACHIAYVRAECSDERLCFVSSGFHVPSWVFSSYLEHVCFTILLSILLLRRSSYYLYTRRL